MRRKRLSRGRRRLIKKLNRVIRRGRKARKVKRAVISRGGVLY